MKSRSSIISVEISSISEKKFISRAIPHEMDSFMRKKTLMFEVQTENILEIIYNAYCKKGILILAQGETNLLTSIFPTYLWYDSSLHHVPSPYLNIICGLSKELLF